jgi:hypothetical protein
MLVADQQIGRADVGRQHAFFDQAVRIVARARMIFSILPFGLQTM